MSEEATAAMTNLELSRELYTEDQRNQFYTDYQAARCAAKEASSATNPLIEEAQVLRAFSVT